MRFWRRRTIPNALYISIWVVFADYDKVTNFINNLCQNCSQRVTQIDIWAHRDRIFEIWGCFLWWQICNDFFIGKKSDRKSEIGVKVRAGLKVRTLGGVGGMRRSPWNLFY